MPRRFALMLAAIAIGLTAIVTPLVVPTAHAGISVPLPPPSSEPEPPGTGKTLASEVVVPGPGTLTQGPAAVDNGKAQYPITEARPR